MLHYLLPEAESIPIALTINELLTNAVKHSPQGDVRCQLACSDDAVQLQIRNQGACARVSAWRSFLAACRGWAWCARCCRGAAPRSTCARTATGVVTEVALKPPSVMREAG